MSSSSCPARNASSSPSRSCAGMRRLPRENEAVLAELGDQGVNDVHQVAAVSNHGPLPVARGPGLEHLIDDVELLRAAQPGGHRLKLGHQFEQLVPDRGGGTG